MYIKLTFKRQDWSVPGSNAGCIDTLNSMPVMVDKLRDGEKPGCYMPVRSLLRSSKPDLLCYYIDCTGMSRADVESALHLFKSFYDIDGKGLPSVLSGDRPEQNEIIANMNIAIENVLRPSYEWQQFQSGNAVTSVGEMINKLMC